MSWQIFEAKNPKMAAFGSSRLHGQVAYLATVRKDGGPRIHPVTPIIGEGHLFVFMEPTSPKGHDIRRNGVYALHCGVQDTSGGSGEFTVSGQAHYIDQPELRALAVRLAPYTPAERYILFEFSIERAASTIYLEEGVVRQRWQAAG